MPKSLLWWGAALVGLLVLLRFVVIWAEPWMTFHPTRGSSASPRDYGVSFVEHRIPTSDGEVVVVWQLPHPNPVGELVFFHGNAGNLSLWLGFLIEAAQRGLSVTALDYRGYGESSGSPTESGLEKDVEATLELFWSKIHQSDRPVVYWGRSLGGPFAAYATRLRSPDALILEATFRNKNSLLRHFPVLRALNVFSRFRFPTLKHLKDSDCPILVVHGDRDTVVPLEEGEVLFEDLKEPKQFLLIPGGNHGGLQSVEPEIYWNTILEFVSAADRSPNPRG